MEEITGASPMKYNSFENPPNPKALASISVTVSGIVMLLSAGVLANAYGPMMIRLSGMFTLAHPDAKTNA